ncbi:hypothetical protein PGB90_000767 [Kerria lacca]
MHRAVTVFNSKLENQRLTKNSSEIGINKRVENDKIASLDIDIVDLTFFRNKKNYMASEDTLSQSSDSKGINENEIAFLTENLNTKSDNFEKISTETIDIASLLLHSGSEDNENYEQEENTIERENLNESDIHTDKNQTNNVEISPILEHDNWGENKRRQSLMMKNALKNNLESFAAMEILKSNVNELLKATSNSFENGMSLDISENDMYAWASSCANLNPVGPRFKLIKEGDIQICYLDHTRTVISKILSFKFLRHFELHHLYLNDSRITPKNINALLP